MPKGLILRLVRENPDQNTSDPGMICLEVVSQRDLWESIVIETYIESHTQLPNGMTSYEHTILCCAPSSSCIPSLLAKSLFRSLSRESLKNLELVYGY